MSIICLGFSLFISSATTGDGDGRRRLIEGASEVVLNENDWYTYKDQCADLDFKLSLLVDKHLMIVASPENKAEAIIQASRCPPLLLHAKISQNGDQEKEVIAVTAADAAIDENSPSMDNELEFVEETLRDNAIALGSFVLSDIAYAYDHAEANADELLMMMMMLDNNANDNNNNKKKKKYDIVMNNCGAFVRNFGTLLGIEESDDKIMAVAQNLLKHGGESFVGMIRSSDHYSVLVADETEDVDDLELVRRLVERAP